MSAYHNAAAFEYRVGFEDRPLSRLLAAQAARTPNRTCLIWNGTDRWSYAELDDRAGRMAASLQDLGVQRGDRVAIVATNCPEYVFATFAIARLGAVAVTVNVHARGLQLEHILRNSEPRAILTQAAVLEHILVAKAQLGLQATIVIVGGLPDDQELPSGAHDGNRLFDSAPLEDTGEVGYTDLAQILYTSGTTGPSKGVMISHNQAYSFAEYVAQAMEMSPDDVYFTCLPLFHVNAQLSLLSCVINGATLALFDRFSASAFWGQVRSVEATVVSLFGAMAYILYKQPRELDEPTKLRVCWAFPAPYDILDDFERRYGFRVLTAYASTEANFVAIAGVRDDVPEGAAGRIHPRFEVEVVDAFDRPMPRGETGEIVTRPRDPFTMMSGYYRMPDVTAEAFRNLWYHTGDAGWLDDDGNLYFVDRIKDVIRRRGENISSYEVEQVVGSHFSVAECAVVAVRSELSEDEVLAVVVLRDGHELQPAELIEWCGERMAYYMVPRFVRFVTELPKTPTGKVEKFQLRVNDEGETWDRQAGSTS